MPIVGSKYMVIRYDKIKADFEGALNTKYSAGWALNSIYDGLVIFIKV